MKSRLFYNHTLVLRKESYSMHKDTKFKTYVVYVPPVFEKLPDVLPKYPMPGESYNYSQMSDVISIFDKRWKSAGSIPDREPFAVASTKEGVEIPGSDRITRDIIYSAITSDAYIEAVSERESSNKFINELLSLDCSLDDHDDLDEVSETTAKPHGGGNKCQKEKKKKESPNM